NEPLHILIICLCFAACGPLLAQTPAPDPPGLLERLTERAKEKVQRAGAAVLGFAEVYYEDHLQPVASSYYQWASTWRDNITLTLGSDHLGP
uniref:Apolipoprotein C-IV n=1 Tax=Periophthalmus magnuspinnatus TaxID=409849 RepID=A0A3B3ZIB6_9GOBI